MPFRFLVALGATGTSALEVVGILVALFESYGYTGRKEKGTPERKILNVADPNFSQCGGPTWGRRGIS